MSRACSFRNLSDARYLDPIVAREIDASQLIGDNLHALVASFNYADVTLERAPARFVLNYDVQKSHRDDRRLPREMQMKNIHG